jgi:pseudaminic acid cytidylyltransferase
MNSARPVIAIIPARGGSKRIPKKNIRLFAGAPMISYSIRAARTTGLFERILVSTDSDEIARIACECGAEVPFRRPADLSDDHTPTAPVLVHALRWLEERNVRPKIACCIYATAPMLQTEDLRRGYETLVQTGAGSAFSVTSFPYSIFRALRVTPEGTVAMFWPEHRLTRSQDLPPAYHDAGQFYWFDVDRFLAEPNLYADARPIILQRSRVQDIDTLEDWATAEQMFRALQERN